jgi:hypothetical protein
VSAGVLMDGALIDLQPPSQFVDGNAVGVTLDQLLHLGWFEAPADPSMGSSSGRFGSRWEQFEEVPETFSLVRMVQVTSHYLHSVHVTSDQVDPECPTRTMGLAVAEGARLRGSCVAPILCAPLQRSDCRIGAATARRTISSTELSMQSVGTTP